MNILVGGRLGWRRCMDAEREDMKSGGVREDNAEKRVRWKQMIGL